MERRPKRRLTPFLAEYFRCPRFAARMQRASCVASFKLSRGKARIEGVAPMQSRCRGCPIGEAHAKGRAHDLAPVLPPVVPAVAHARGPQRRLCMCGCGEVIPPGRKHYAGLACAKAAGKSMGAAADHIWAGA